MYFSPGARHFSRSLELIKLYILYLARASTGRVEERITVTTMRHYISHTLAAAYRCTATPGRPGTGLCLHIPSGVKRDNDGEAESRPQKRIREGSEGSIDMRSKYAVELTRARDKSVCILTKASEPIDVAHLPYI